MCVVGQYKKIQHMCRSFGAPHCSLPSFQILSCSIPMIGKGPDNEFLGSTNLTTIQLYYCTIVAMDYPQTNECGFVPITLLKTGCWLLFDNNCATLQFHSACSFPSSRFSQHTLSPRHRLLLLSYTKDITILFFFSLCLWLHNFRTQKVLLSNCSNMLIIIPAV